MHAVTALIDNPRVDLAAPPVGTAPQPQATDAEAGQQLRGWVLLVEDNQINQIVATNMLGKLGLKWDLVRTAPRPCSRCRTTPTTWC